MSLQDPQSPPEPRTGVGVHSHWDEDRAAFLSDYRRFGTAGTRRAEADLPATSEQALATLVMRDDDIGKGCPWLIAGAVAWSAAMVLLGAVIW